MTHLVASELLKLRTTRAPYGLVLAVLALSALTVVALIGSGSVDDDERAFSLADAAEASGILATVLGILLVTNEYRHGTITQTFLATPVRERVIAAKLVAGACAGLVVGALATVVALAIAVPWLAARDEPLDGDLGRAVGALVVAFVLAALFGVAIGWAIHSQIAAIVGTFAWFLFVEPLVIGLSVLLERYTAVDAEDVARYLPGSVLDAIVSQGQDDVLAPRWALPLAVVYLAALVAVGVLVTLRRDAE